MEENRRLPAFVETREPTSEQARGIHDVLASPKEMKKLVDGYMRLDSEQVFDDARLQKSLLIAIYYSKIESYLANKKCIAWLVRNRKMIDRNANVVDGW